MGISRYVFIYFLLLPFYSFCNDIEFYTTKVKPGDNVEQLLLRFHLTPSVCNVDLFCKINNIKNKNHIIAHKDYKIPVQIVSYNGKSIRSTLGIDDLDKAKRIQSYNEKMLSAGLRSSDFRVSKLLWVPMEELDCNIGPNNLIDLKTSTSVGNTNTLSEAEAALEVRSVPSGVLRSHL